MIIPEDHIKQSVKTALAEDIGSGDVSGDLIPKTSSCHATVITREDAIICGIDWLNETFNQLDPTILIDWQIKDGDKVKANQIICKLFGPAHALLSGERTALNFLQTLSATATIANQYANAISSTKAKVLDTRKTIPGLRLAQKYAVSCGGCKNHRIGLYDAILIKENHILAAGSILNAVKSARSSNPELSIEVEVENLDELQQALEVKADRVLLDNFDIKTLIEAVKIANKSAELEASGNVTLKTIREIAETGVDFISTGAITKNIRAIDLSMRFSH
jgi:nicotinate-nucleotide pyrophosphorylase (carboxylating)